MHPAAISSSGNNANKPSNPPERNDSSDQATILHCSMVQVWYSHAHCRRFCSGHGSSLTAAMQPYTQQTDIFLSWPALGFKAIWATPHMHQWALGPWPWRQFTDWTSLYHCINHCITETPYKTYCFGDALTLLHRHHCLALVKVTFFTFSFFLLPTYEI